ncbi:hypothetical protein BDN71DRAFT_1446327 [Pleurotus eryngii]|uniref:Uncharacterized protein n=1 Tax=Pleurotus eryngii TaxID=5323 RepID=A0A9P5ZYG4_PLEER|nr:hypothetical protein BDN71DRAFT_1446327 [Pleurotus eryngii]
MLAGNSAARLRGFEDELRLSSTQNSTLLSILFVGYILMQIPSNMLMNYLGMPSTYLPCCAIARGLITVLSEAAFVPGALFLLSRRYKRST